MSLRSVRGPVKGPEGWSCGNGTLPVAMDELHLYRIISKIIDHRSEGVLVLAHHNADIDAVGTAMILKESFPWVKLGAFKSISHAGRNLLDHFGVDMEIDPVVTDHSLIIVVDSSSPLQVSEGDLSSWPEYIVVDHHPDHDHWHGDHISTTLLEHAWRSHFRSLFSPAPAYRTG